MALHCVFDKGFNDVPMDSLYPNAQHLLRNANGNDLTEIQDFVDAGSKLEFYTYPFWKSKPLLSMFPPLTKIPLLVSKWKQMNFINEFISVMLRRNQQPPVFTSPKMVSGII